MKYAELITADIPQTEPLNERQVRNNAGGYVFQVDDWSRFQRFLILGSDAPTYYQTAQKLTRENASCVERCYASDPARTAVMIADISTNGRAPKNDAAIFALAIGAASKDVRTRQLALARLGYVCRTGTHLFQFVIAVRALGRGWGRTLKRAVAKWYDTRDVSSVAYQAIKYRSRENYSHKRLLQTAHPAGDKSVDREALYRWICGKEHDPSNLPAFVTAHLKAMATDDVSAWAALVREYDLPWEALPTEANAKPEVWQALLPRMGLTALVRNLGNMSRVGAIKPLSEAEKIAVKRLDDTGALRKSMLHPFTILQAMAIYNSGKGMRGSGTWEASQPIVAALDRAFYSAFANVVPTNKRNLIGLDISSSMSSSACGGSVLTAAEGAAAMAMVTVRKEPWSCVMGFAHDFRDLKITASDSLQDVMAKTTRQNFGSTDCALPMTYAMGTGLEVDTFYVYTDNETWSGRGHPVEALKAYRKKSGINAKLIVVAMTSTGFSIADPNDGGMLDVVGFDSAAPAVMADFASG